MQITTDEQELDRLYEELTLTREVSDGLSGCYGGYMANPRTHSWWQYQIDTHMDVLYKNHEGNLHRTYGPAYISKKYKTEKWFKNGILHRENGPALTHKKTQIWYYEGQLHRLDGPAYISPNGPREYWIHGQRLPPKEYKKEIERRKRKGLIK